MSILDGPLPMLFLQFFWSHLQNKVEEIDVMLKAIPYPVAFAIPCRIDIIERFDLPQHRNLLFSEQFTNPLIFVFIFASTGKVLSKAGVNVHAHSDISRSIMARIDERIDGVCSGIATQGRMRYSV